MSSPGCVGDSVVGETEGSLVGSFVLGIVVDDAVVGSAVVGS